MTLFNLNTHFRGKLVNQEILLDQLEKEKVETSSLKNRLVHLESKFKAFTEGEMELLDQNASLEKQVYFCWIA